MAEHEPAEPIESTDSTITPAPAGALLARSAGALPGLPTGTGIGKYRILERIRTYHNAAVYKARDTMLDRLVAIKQMCPALIDNPIACGHFKREAQLLARIPKDSRHVLNVHELIEDDAGLFIVEEFIQGEWLESLLSKRHIGVEGAVRLLKTAALGVRTLHQHQIVHRDLQPGNVMVTRSGAAKIANFASAAHEGDLGSPPVISPKYSAPELLLEKNYDNRVDIYSLGVVLFEICVGRRAMDNYFRDIVNDPLPVSRWMQWQTDASKSYPDAAELNPLVSAELSAIIRQMTAKSLDERFTSTQEVLDAIAGRIGEQQADSVPRRSVPALSYLPGPGVRSVHPTRTAAVSASPASTLRLEVETASNTAQTSTRTVQSSARLDRTDILSRTADAPPTSRRPIRSGGVHRGPYRHRPPLAAPRAAPIKAVPILAPVSEKHVNRQRRRSAKSAAVVLLMMLSGAGGFIAWDQIGARVPDHPIEQVLAGAWKAFDEFDYATSRQRFRQAAAMNVLHAKHQGLKQEAERALQSLLPAGEAVRRRDYDDAQKMVADARKWGLSPARVEQIQSMIWDGKDAVQTSAEAFDGLRSGNFDSVEMRVDEYEKKAPAANLDPGLLRRQLDVVKQDRKYNEYLKRAEAAMAKGDYQSAGVHVTDAEEIAVPTSRTRDLRKRIMDAENQLRAEKNGDEAMVREDFHDAARHYDEATMYRSSPEIEKKVRLARASVSFNDAKLAISKGDLIGAEEHLRTSLWNTELPEAKAKNEKMQPIFEAARSVRDADRIVESGKCEEAIRIYEAAIPRLPAPADEMTRRKIDRAKAIRRGDLANAQGEWLEAIEAYEEALAFGPDMRIQDRLKKAKARLPDLPSKFVDPDE